jgi:hypothetical protein
MISVIKFNSGRSPPMGYAGQSRQRPVVQIGLNRHNIATHMEHDR